MILTICDKCGKIIDVGHNGGDKFKSTIGYEDKHLCKNCEQNILNDMRNRDEMLGKISETLK